MILVHLRPLHPAIRVLCHNNTGSDCTYAKVHIQVKPTKKKKKKDSPDRCLATVQIRDYPLTKNWIDECAKQCPTMILDQEPFALPSTFPFPYFSLYPNIAVTSVDELRRKKSVGRPDEIWGLSLQRNINVHDDEPTCGKRIYTDKKIRLVVCLL